MIFALLSLVPNVTADRLSALAAASAPVLADVAAAWATVDPSIVAPTVRVVASVSELTDDDVPVVFVAALPPEDVADLALHSIGNDSRGVARPYAIVLAEPGMAIDEITIGAFHEMAEALVDPTCDKYDGDNDREVCDPVQGRRITRNGVALSAYVTPRWAGYACNGPCVVSDDGADLAPGAHDPDGYVMHEDGSEDPAGYKPVRARDHWHSRRARRKRTAGRVRPMVDGAP